MDIQIQQQLPIFKSPSPNPPLPIYFLHIINPTTATLTIQVLGPNLSFKFTHTPLLRASIRASIRASTIHRALDNKTVGFLTLIYQNQRIILSWAESGHGAGKLGDVLDATPGGPLLQNKIWTRRVINMGKLLGLNMKRPYDYFPSATLSREMLSGMFLGSHVEVKLAVFGICVLLRVFDITSDWNNITASHLIQLRTVKWTDGSRPSFEIYFSRKNCRPCGTLISRLSQITGVHIALCWKERLTPKVYAKKLTPLKAGTLVAPQDEEVLQLGELIVIEDSDASDGEGREGMNERVDEYVNGLAYCVGQMDEAAPVARAAIVDFARRIKAQKVLGDINKPLPATPVTEMPGVDLEVGASRVRLYNPQPGQREIRRVRKILPVQLGRRAPRGFRERSVRPHPREKPIVLDGPSAAPVHEPDIELIAPGVRGRSPRPNHHTPSRTTGNVRKRYSFNTTKHSLRKKRQRVNKHVGESIPVDDDEVEAEAVEEVVEPEVASERYPSPDFTLF